ncbi:GntR family transcriptional regulator [Bifidobacterium moukalabense]|uniref:GntR family transcriptional regulator n=1 Tax=Bifidobacterium moukalabense TaxID=1333651 RepID=UPI0010F89771|nr:GntR family transcriptional regulator [Bifidobacterium moukalabense]
MEDRIDAGRRRPATSELVHRIRALIRDQELHPGERLGSERALAQSFGISRSDLRTALAVLEASHEVIRKIGRAGGIVVSDGRLERNINTVESLPAIARRQGMRVSSKVLQAVIAPASPSDIRLLKLPGEHPMIYDITRLRHIEDRPLSVERSRLPAYLFPMFLTRDLTTPFYTMFERDYGIRPYSVDETLESVVGGDRENELLEIEPETPLMRIHRIAFTDEGTPFERAIDVYIADRMRFTMHHSGYVRLSATHASAK